MSARLGEAVVIARSDVRRRVRKFSENGLLGMLFLVPVGLAVLAVVGALPLPGYEQVRAAPGAFVYGTDVAAGADGTVLERTRGFAGVLFLLATYAAIMGEARAGETVAAHHELYLLTSTTATVAVGEFLKRLLFSSGLFGLVVVAGALAFGAGAGSPATTALLLCSGVALLITAVAVGQFATVLAKHALATTDAPGWLRRLVGGGLILLACTMVVRFRRATAVLGDTPLGWYGDLGLLATSVEGSAVASAAVLVVVPVAVLTNLSVLTRYAPKSWLDTYTHGTSTEESGGPATADATEQSDGPATAPGTTAGSRSERVEGFGAAVESLLERVVSRPVASLVVISWRRVYRTPESLLYVVALLPFGAVAAASIAAERPALVPVVAAVYASTLAAAGITLNPIGNEGRALPLTLTTPGGHRTLVVGYALSALAPGVVVVPGAVLVACSLLGLPALQSSVFVVLGVLLAATTSFASVAVGAVLPQYEGTRLATNGGVQTPRFDAILVVLLVSLAVATPVLVGVQSPASGTALATVPDAVPLVASLTASSLLALGVIRASVRYAVSKLRTQRVL
jgi:hypothetical protein